MPVSVVSVTLSADTMRMEEKESAALSSVMLLVDPAVRVVCLATEIAPVSLMGALVLTVRSWLMELVPSETAPVAFTVRSGAVVEPVVTAPLEVVYVTTPPAVVASVVMMLPVEVKTVMDEPALVGPVAPSVTAPPAVMARELAVVD